MEPSLVHTARIPGRTNSSTSRILRMTVSGLPMTKRLSSIIAWYISSVTGPVRNGSLARVARTIASRWSSAHSSRVDRL